MKKSPTDNITLHPKQAMSLGKKLLLITVVALAALATLCSAIYFSYRGIYLNNDFLTLGTIDIRPQNDDLKRRILTILNSDEICVRPGEITLPNINCGEIRHAILDKCPLIKELNVYREFPSTLIIEGTERKPVAWLSITPKKGKSVKLKIDGQGTILPATTPYSGLLPLITGLPADGNYRPGTSINNQGVAAFLDFLELKSQRPEGIRYDVYVCNVDNEKRVINLTLNSHHPFVQGARIVLPIFQMQDALDKLQNIVATRMQKQETISFIDLSFKNIPVRP